MMPDGARPRVLVSVLNYNSPQRAIDTLASLTGQTYPNRLLQVIDNGSAIPAADRIHARFPDVEVVRSAANLGYAGGNNLALERALRDGFDHVLMCNDDIALDPDGVRHLVATAEAHADAGVVGGVEVDAATDRVRTTGGMQPPDWRCRIRWTVEEPSDGRSATRVLFVQGSAVLFTRRALERQIRFEERLFMYWDEIELGYELASRGLAAYVDHRVVIRHRNQPITFHPRAGYLQQRNRVFIAGRRFPPWRRALFLLYSTFGEVPAKLAVRTLQGHPRFAAACALGHWDGIRSRMGAGRIESFEAVR